MAHQEELAGGEVAAEKQTAPQCDPAASMGFIKLLHPVIDWDRQVLLWTLNTKMSHWISREDQMGEVVSEILSRKDNVYLGVGQAPQSYGPNGRCKSDQIIAIPGVWVDIDILGPAHKSKNLVPDVQTALDVLHGHLPPPTVTVHSGNGIQAFWLFPEPWVLSTEEERKAAKAFVKQWVDTVRALFKQAGQSHGCSEGWGVDPVGELARVMRLPGSVNNKQGCPPVLARVIEMDETRRYTQERLSEFFAHEPEKKTTDGSMSQAGERSISLPLVSYKTDTRYPAEAILQRFVVEGHNGNRNNTCYKLAQQLHWNGYGRDEAEPIIERFCKAVGTDSSFKESDAQRTADSAYNSEPREGWTLPQWLVGGGDEEGKIRVAADGTPFFALTDVGNAHRLIYYHGVDLLHVEQWGKWLVWNGTHWEESPAGAKVERLAMKTVKKVYVEASKADTPEERRAISKWASASENGTRLREMVRIARSFESVSVGHEALDRQHHLLPCRNGTLNLDTGEFREARREDLFTKVIPVDYDPEAQCPRWEAFVSWAMGGDDEMVRFLQRCIGYSLTGLVKEQVMFFLYGEGANGKSTVVNTVLAMLGDLGRQMDPNIIVQKHNESHPTGLADLDGTRFAAITETEDGKRLAEGEVKRLTGGEKIPARRMRQDYYEFEPTHKLWMTGNHKPDIRGRDKAIWRRIVLIPFEQTVTEEGKDPDLVGKLKEELPGILTWAVRGCIEWREKGLAIPQKVKQAVAEYRAETDYVGEFIMERSADSEQSQGGSEVRGGIPCKDFYDSYREWSQRMGASPLTMLTFNKNLKERGWEQRKPEGKGRIWVGKTLV